MCDQHDFDANLHDAAGNTGCHTYVHNHKLCHNPIKKTHNQKTSKAWSCSGCSQAWWSEEKGFAN